MGCDIHVWLEYSTFNHGDHAATEYRGKPYWRAMTDCFNPGRDYLMFGIMAAVRAEEYAIFHPRGLPEGLSYTAKESVEKWGDDLHSESWLTTDELAQCLGEYFVRAQHGPYDVEWDAIHAAMRAFEERGAKARLVFGFDN